MLKLRNKKLIQKFNLLKKFTEIIKEKILMIRASMVDWREWFIKGNCTNLNLNKIGDVSKVKLNVLLASVLFF